MVQPTAPFVQSGLGISASGRTLSVTPGALYIDDLLVRVGAAKQLNIPVAPPLSKRLDTLYIDSTGAVGCASGVPALNAPEPAPIPAGGVALAHVVVNGPAALADSAVLPISRDGNALFFADRAQNQKALSRTIARLQGQKPVRIMYWGDSITCGANASSAELGFAATSERMLKRHFKDNQIVSQNLGIGGSSINMRIDQLEGELTKFRPDVVVIEFINDLKLTQPVLEQCYERVDDLTQRYGAEVIFVEPFLPSPKLVGLSNFQDVASRPYYGFVRATARKYGWALADCGKRWESLDREGLRGDLLLADGLVHLNNHGHKMVAEEVFKCFR
jgi:lysophospholipase L1-like esterase